MSHELRTPLARILALLDSAELDGADVPVLLEQARAEVVHAGALIDEILFLSELESGKEIVALGRTRRCPCSCRWSRPTRRPPARAGVTLRVEGDPSLDVPLRPRMLKIVAENLTMNAIRYAGPGAVFTLSAVRAPEGAVLVAADDGIGVDEAEIGAAVRALLARRLGARLARDRASASRS